ncbi:hypothetical protein COCMIDRAFT_90320 [Bipolaris oryzae ATCC 44560]|uniref:Uncharacterized protein n=1 Tax=Bipolaris oryzae ATCC 44560 TaxID=930090 RepID=W6ZIX5_COCMI|nr:uncharacterized protein COCMIDRAFT_90320 [Bipolaris oryzae ATCC 44560]EUC47374.1 hypothetical protein COCMIDRAFT_90320 [Bipolaris oryzae ATCC 44560]
MARDSLLRHIFKRGPLSLKYRKRTRSAPFRNNESDESLILERPHYTRRPSSWRDEIPDDHDTRRMHRNQDTSYDSYSTTSATSPTTFSSSGSSLTNTLLLAHPWIHRPTSPLAISTRDLFFAVVQEAVAATTLHMNTLDRALEMLETMQGLSATVDVLRGEMQEKRKACEVVRKELLQFGEVIRALGLVE